MRSNELTLASLQTAQWHIYTDGAAQGGTLCGGAGAVIIHQPSRVVVCKLAVPAGLVCSSFRAEMVAIREALTALASHLKLGDRVLVFTDSQSTIRRLSSGATEQKTRLGQETWMAIRRIFHLGCASLHLQFVFGHSGLHGNEAADELAGSGSRLPQHGALTDWDSARAAIRRACQSSVQSRTRADLASDRRHPNHQWLRVTAKPEDRAAWKANRDMLERRDYSRVLQLRTGNADWLGYYRSKLQRGKTPPTCDRCGAPLENAEHFLLHCPALAEIRLRILGDAPSLSMLSTCPAVIADYVRSALGDDDVIHAELAQTITVNDPLAT